ncbi:TPA: serine hydrolase, partial [Klebsiella pneumoniae]|nr:serine hydrolase [Klebsiella pneumoniae]
MSTVGFSSFFSLKGENPPCADFSRRAPIYILRSESMANEEMTMIRKPLALALILAA